MTRKTKEQQAAQNVGDRETAVVRCEKVVKRFGSFAALKGICAEIYSGEVVCIVGPSGGGKSTFLRTLNGLEPIQEGEIHVLDMHLPGSKRDIETLRRSVGMVFQSFNLFLHMSIRDNLTLAPVTALGLSKQEANARAERLLKRVGIADQIDKFPGQLSGGQQQRVAIARALAMEPKIMLFDEPTSSLDPEMVKEVLDVIRDLAASGMTMLVVTHEMGFAREVADRVFFIADGQLFVDAPPKEFFGKPKDERQAAFLSKIL